MSWFKKARGRVFAVFICLVAASSLSACGFEPMYGTMGVAGRAADAAMPDIYISNIPDRDGQYFRNIMMDRLYTHGTPENAAYILTFAPLHKDIVYLGIQKNGTATRAQIGISTEMHLTDSASGKVLLTRSLKTVGAYNLLEDQLATMMSQQNITESILQEMRDDAATQLSLYFRRAAKDKTARDKNAEDKKPVTPENKSPAPSPGTP